MCWNRQAFGTALIKMHISEEEEGGRFWFFTRSCIWWVGSLTCWWIYSVFIFYHASYIWMSNNFNTWVKTFKQNSRIIHIPKLLTTSTQKCINKAPKSCLDVFVEDWAERKPWARKRSWFNLMQVFLMLQHQKSTKNSSRCPPMDVLCSVSIRPRYWQWYCLIF